LSVQQMDVFGCNLNLDNWWLRKGVK
jgi:hypothetical protein